MTNLEKASEMVENNPELKGKLEAEIRRPMENKEMDTNKLNTEELNDVAGGGAAAGTYISENI